MGMANRTLAGTALLCLCLGALHAFSVLLEPWEQRLEAPRGAVSLIYSTAILALTAAILLGHRLYPLGARRLAVGVALLAAAGLALAATAPGVGAALLGYGALFGFANGIGYGLSLHCAARAWPARKGAAIGIVTAAYAGGAMLFARLLPMLLAEGGVPAALLGLAGLVAAGSLAAAALLPAAETAGAEAAPAGPGGREPELARLWLGYLCGATAGLMAIGHAAGIVAASGGSAGLVASGAAAVALGNAAGGLAGGTLADRLPVRRVLAGAALLAAAALLALAAQPPAPAAVGLLGLVGAAYGALIALYPVAIVHRFGPAKAARLFGRVFTAWGAAGLIGPGLAGLLYDLTGGYGLALLAAALAAAACAALALRLRREAPSPVRP